MKLLYLEGDTCSLKYLQGAFDALGVEADLPDPLPADLDDYDAILISDFPARKLGETGIQSVADSIAQGTGLLAVGGWRSFGRGGYATTPVGDALPVEITHGDDRRALVQGAHPRKRMDHDALADLDWDHAPVLCGMNHCVAKPEATTILELAGAPLLVAGEHGRGRVLVYTSDLAPHWSGGLTDWGETKYPGPQGEEMGEHYVAFVGAMLRWCAREVENTVRPGGLAHA